MVEIEDNTVKRLRVDAVFNEKKKNRSEKMQLKAAEAPRKNGKDRKRTDRPTEKRGNLSQLFCIVRITTEKWCRHTPKTRKFLNPPPSPPLNPPYLLSSAEYILRY